MMKNMKASELLNKIRENLKDYPIEPVKNQATNDIFPDNIYKRLAIYNSNTYDEIFKNSINEDFEVNDKIIKNIERDIDYYFDIYDPYDEETRNFTKYISLYLALIGKKPLHPFSDNPKDGVFLKNGTYYCKERITSIKVKGTLCKYCICKNMPIQYLLS